MKKILSLTLAFGILFTGNIMAQSIDGVIESLKTGNAAQLVANAGDNISLTIADKNDNYSKAQAAQILREFFEKAPVKGFELKHKGDSPNGRYAIGTLLTSGSKYRVNIFMRNEGTKEVMRELRFQMIE